MDENQSLEPRKTSWPSTGRIVTGILLVLLGGIWLIGQFIGQWVVADFWPFFLILGGLIFYAFFFMRAQRPVGFEGMLFPGTYLIVVGLLFLLMNLIGWHNMRYAWPTFVFGVALSLGAMHQFGRQEPERKRAELLSAAKILTLISAVLYLVAIGGIYLWPVALIIIGLAIIISGILKK
jgi:hypothetical protein